MKLRISFFNKAVIRKDITRFAPLWAIYLIGGLLILLSTLSISSGIYVAKGLAVTIGPFSIINMVYAALCAQVLFGDLFSSRLCNALHALPLRRETWFCSHTASGLLFSLVPHLIGALWIIPMLGEYAFVALIWLLGMTLEYLFFFGLAVLCVFCTGNRVAMVAVYSILNFASLILSWMISTLYIPLLLGVTIQTDIFHWFCPVVKMTTLSRFLVFTVNEMNPAYHYQGMGTHWWYLALCAGLGIAFLVLSLVLYRRRKLECAGDFIAVRPLGPVFAVVFTLCVGSVFAMVQQLFGEDYLLFLCIGLAVGWFTGQMLLQRTVKVFQTKRVLQLGLLGLALGLTLLVTRLDPMGIARWIPTADQVTSAQVELGAVLELTDSDEIQDLIGIHAQLIEDGSPRYGRRVTIRYTLANGRAVTRTYRMEVYAETWQALEKLYRSPELVLGYKDWEYFVENAQIYLPQGELEALCKEYAKQQYPNDQFAQGYVLYKELSHSLLEAMKADCEKGLLPQTLVDPDYHSYSIIMIEVPGSNGYSNRHINIFEESTNTVAWMKEYGIMFADIDGKVHG